MTDNPPKTTSPETTTASAPDHPRTRAQPAEDGNSSTTGPVIVLVSVPEWRRKLEKDRDKFAMKNPFLRHVDDSDHMHEMSPSKTDYVKNIHKGNDERVKWKGAFGRILKSNVLLACNLLED